MHVHKNGKPISQSKYGVIYFLNSIDRDLAFLILNGKIEFVFWIAIGDDFDVTKWMFSELPIDLSRLTEIDFCDLLPIIPLLKNAMEEAIQYKLNAGKSVGNYNLAKCRYITDQLDLYLPACMASIKFGTISNYFMFRLLRRILKLTMNYNELNLTLVMTKTRRSP